jgi:hypothetical protein
MMGKANIFGISVIPLTKPYSFKCKLAQQGLVARLWAPLSWNYVYFIEENIFS